MSGPAPMMPRWLLWACLTAGVLIARLIPQSAPLSWAQTGMVITVATVVLALHWAVSRDWARRRPMPDCDCEVCCRLRREGYR